MTAVVKPSLVYLSTGESKIYNLLSSFLPFSSSEENKQTDETHSNVVSLHLKGILVGLSLRFH